MTVPPSSNRTTGLLPAARLWSKTSAKGKPYLAGRLGLLRVTVMPLPEGDAREDGATHQLLFSEPQGRQETGR